MTRLHKIQRAVRDISTNAPTTDNRDLMWFKPDRGSPDYYRLVPRDGLEERGGYDVWMETEAGFDRAGHMQIRCDVVLYDLSIHDERMRETVFGRGFDGYDQPREQAFLNNVHHYERQAREHVQDFAETAEVWASHELVDQPDPEVVA